MQGPLKQGGEDLVHRPRGWEASLGVVFTIPTTGSSKPAPEKLVAPPSCCDSERLKRVRRCPPPPPHPDLTPSGQVGSFKPLF